MGHWWSCPLLRTHRHSWCYDAQERPLDHIYHWHILAVLLAFRRDHAFAAAGRLLGEPAISLLRWQRSSLDAATAAHTAKIVSSRAFSRRRDQDQPRVCSPDRSAPATLRGEENPDQRGDPLGVHRLADLGSLLLAEWPGQIDLDCTRVADPGLVAG